MRSLRNRGLRTGSRTPQRQQKLRDARMGSEPVKDSIARRDPESRDLIGSRKITGEKRPQFAVGTHNLGSIDGSIARRRSIAESLHECRDPFLVNFPAEEAALIKSYMRAHCKRSSVLVSALGLSLGTTTRACFSREMAGLASSLEAA